MLSWKWTYLIRLQCYFISINCYFIISTIFLITHMNPIEMLPLYGSKCTPPFDLFHSMQNSFNLSILVNPTLVNVLRILYNRSPPMRFKAMPETRKRTTVVTVGQISIRQRSITLFTTDKGNSRRLSCHLITFVKSW